jgi:23S rRNA (cytidine1920-2'-O)/16S rRNA (cytidine1409-2'-O)-methyltransferase
MKERLDRLIVKRGLLASRDRAKAYIIGGSITVNGERVTRPAALFEETAVIGLRIPNQGYVSRGGIKLAHALEVRKMDARGCYCLDIGASTGGFTDCLLQRGAHRVIAVDVGRNQIAYSLRIDPRVRVVEKFNARYIDRLDIDVPDIVTIDVSFISLTRITEPLIRIVDVRSDVICLVKPQFELDKPYSGFRGVVRDLDRHIGILRRICAVVQMQGYTVCGGCFSPIMGPRGNIEFFIHIHKKDEPLNVHRGSKPDSCNWVKNVVETAHSFFKTHSRKNSD